MTRRGARRQRATGKENPTDYHDALYERAREDQKRELLVKLVRDTRRALETERRRNRNMRERLAEAVRINERIQTTP